MPRGIASADAKANGHGKAAAKAQAKAVSAKSLVAIARSSKLLMPATGLPTKAAKAKSKKAASAAAVTKQANGSARGTKASTAMRRAFHGTHGSAKTVAARERNKSIEVKTTATKPPPNESASSNGLSRTNQVASKGNGIQSRRAISAKKSAAKTPITDLPTDYRPSDSEPFMGELHRLYFRRKLITWRDEILRSTKETLQSLHDDQAHYADIADRATSESDKALELRARDRQRKLIAKIDAAIERIDRGTYGYCDETGEPIAVRRLDARPIATLSIEAQERHERRERVYRDD